MGLFSKAKARLAYERESYEMSREELKQIQKEFPELYVKGYWRMTAAERRAAVKREK